MAFLTRLSMRSFGRFVLAFCCLALIVWLGYQQFYAPDKARSAESSDNTEPNHADVYGETINFTQLKPDGRVHYKLQAQTITQYEDDQLSYLEEPRLHLTSADAAPWDIQAKLGKIEQRGTADGQLEDVVFLTEDVVMVQSDPNNGLTTLRSAAFQIYPDREFAETDQNVMIDTQVGRTMAGGMQTDMATGLLILRSSPTQRVHTIILPEQFKRERQSSE